MFYCYNLEYDQNYEEGCFRKSGEYVDCYEMQITCKYCGKRNLEWVLTSNGYRLFSINKKKQHFCKKRP